MVSYVTGDMILLYGDNPNAVIVQQNNCTALLSRKGSLAHDIARAFYPNSDPYATRSQRGPGLFRNLARIEHREKMGDVAIFYNGPEKARVACLYAQYKMGNANSQYYMSSRQVDEEYKKTPDDRFARLRAFRECLKKLEEAVDKKVVVFPERIGCGMAGGDWSKYKIAIEQFANNNNNINVVICQKK